MGLTELKLRHRSGGGGFDVCARWSDLRDAVLCDLFAAALGDLGEDGPRGLANAVTLILHGGSGRRDVAPFSDVDLMLLHAPAVAGRVAPLADRLLRDVFDAGLSLGHSVRTPEQACKLAMDIPAIATSLMESRRLTGDEGLFQQFLRRFRHTVSGRFREILSAVTRERQQERIRFGETVFLLEPNLKRSRGGLRDVQLVRWFGFARYGAADPAELYRLGALSAEDRQSLERAYEFLLWLRNELHFQAGQAADVLSRAEQLRIAELRGYAPAPGLLPVEQLMREVFRHTAAVSHLAERFERQAMARHRWHHWSTALFGHRVEPGVRVGPAGISATRHGLQRLRGDLAAVVRLADLANLYNAPIAPTTWEAVRRAAPQLPPGLPPRACQHFLSLLSHPARLGPLLRDLHEASLLERFLPEFAHARGLLQFNQYHRYTVDEHCLRAVECAVELLHDPGPFGRAYRAVGPKHILHLALLIHDLGKGRLEDHRELGLKIADATAARLGLSPHDAVGLRFLVRHHELMNHEAFHRDADDEQTVVRLAVQVGSPELLEMLYVLTACDLAAVAPGVWDSWKAEIVTGLFHRTMQYLAVETPATTADEQLALRRRAVRDHLGQPPDAPWFDQQLAALPAGYLNVTPPDQAAADLRMLHALPPRSATAAARYLPDTHTVQCVVGASEQTAEGIFHKLTGALSGLGLEIRSAQIFTLADGLILDRFQVRDPDYAAEPPEERLGQLRNALVAAVQMPAGQQPTFRRTWRPGGDRPLALPTAPTRVLLDNTTSDRCTIVDIFAQDRTGLLYAIARTLFELDLSVWRARIATYLDQVVDVFYVTDMQRRKIEDAARLDAIRARLSCVIDAEQPAPLAGGP